MSGKRQAWVVQAKAADKEVITGVSTQNVELDELHSFAGAKHPDEQDSDLEEVGQHWTHVAMARESRLMLEVIVGPRTQESATELVEGAARRLTPDCWPLWSSDGWEPYLFALTVVFAVLIHFIKGKGRGRPKDSQVVPDPRVRYGQVIKQRAVGLILLLTIALRVLVLGQFVARKNIKEQGQKLSGIYAGQPGRQTDRPTMEMMLRAFRGVTLSRVRVRGETHWHLPPLTETQKRILKLLGLSSRTFSKLIPTISKTDFQSREP